MASIPGYHDEVHNFLCKFLSLHEAGQKARFNVDNHGGQLWISLNVQLGEHPGQSVPLLPQHGAASATRQSKAPPHQPHRRKVGRPCREALRARRVLSTFLSLPFHCCKADETQVVDNAQSSAEIVETISRSAEVVDMGALPSLPTTLFQASNAKEEEAAVWRHACKERDT